MPNLRPEKPDPELVLPLTMFGDVVRYPDLVLILPSDSSEGWFARFEQIVKVAAVEDSLFQQDDPPRKGPFLAHVFYDITQIRECKLKDVKGREWYKSLGLNTPQEWIRHYKKAPSSVVRVYHLDMINYNLKDFNKSYGWKLK